MIFFITNSSNSFQNTIPITTGISDCNKMVVTVLKKCFQKSKPRKLIYRSYKDVNKTKFKKELRCIVLNKEVFCTEVVHLGL